MTVQTLKELIEQCWHPNPTRRPNFTTIIAQLTKLLETMPRKVCCTAFMHVLRLPNIAVLVAMYMQTARQAHVSCPDCTSCRM